MNAYLVHVDGKEFSVDLRSDGTIKVDAFEGTITCEHVGANTFSVMLDHMPIDVVAERNGESYQVLFNQVLRDVLVETERDRLLRQYASSSASSHKRLEILAPMPALVIRVEVTVGDAVRPGQGLLILEAMKMENEIKAHQAGNVKEVFVTNGNTVEKGQLLMLLE